MSEKPNFLFLFSDQHRGDWMPYSADVKREMGVEGLELHMPNIKGLMDRGTAFLCAMSPSPVCAPARACLASGMRYKNCRVASNKVNYDTMLPTFYGKLRDAGYFVAGCGKFDLNKADLLWDTELMKALGFSYAEDSEGKMDTIWAALLGKPGPYGRMLEDRGWLREHIRDMSERGNSDEPTPLPDEIYADNWITEKAKGILGDRISKRPWFMQINFSGPHDPWDVTVSMKEKMSERAFPEAADCSFTDKNKGVRENYAAMIENIDERIGEIIRFLDERNALENTVIIYASDHGEMMGDHDMYGKSKPQQGSVHIPLVIDASRVGGKTGIINRSPVELQDLAATFLDYAGIDAENLESESLRPIVEGSKTSVREYAVSELNRPCGKGLDHQMAAVTDGRWKLILEKGERKLYDISKDPFEMKDVEKHYPEIADRLQEAFGNSERKMPEALKRAMTIYQRAVHAV